MSQTTRPRIIFISTWWRRAATGARAAERRKAARYAPAAGHLVHMPSHIYIRVGQYQDAVEANEEAAKADRSYIAACQVQGFYPGVYSTRTTCTSSGMR